MKNKIRLIAYVLCSLSGSFGLSTAHALYENVMYADPQNSPYCLYVKDADTVGNGTCVATGVSNSSLAMNADGSREKKVEGTVTSLFNASADRNAAMVAMLNNEVICEEFNPSSKVGEWGSKQGVKFMCRGSIPPDPGKFAGYIAIGFASKPEDISALKTRINLAATDMSDE